LAFQARSGQLHWSCACHCFYILRISFSVRFGIFKGVAVVLELREVMTGQEEKKWYVLQTYSGHENKVKTNIEKMVLQQKLEDMVFSVKIPSMDVAEMKNGKKKVTKKKLMPGYVLVEMNMNDDLRFKIQSLPSVSSFVGGRGKGPEPLSLDEIKNLFSDVGSMESEEPSRPRFLFKVGETLKIIDGPFANFTGLVDEIFPDKGRLRVKVEIFGRSTPVELDYLQVKSET